ncbi:hypothetical protein Zmor_000386 [Zophobas morio]|uniref:Uncharacterized protein n=1 Tax=Zophobas morio TaxID=2755281 RepID=A0AA38IW25_9CUCU|nr:hypothetical protein Zmor_000386 [Zophobas morio]
MHEFSKIYSHFETRNSVGGYRHESSSVYVYYRTDDSTGFQKFIELGARKGFTRPRRGVLMDSIIMLEMY